MDRLAELERENARLRALVDELVEKYGRQSQVMTTMLARRCEACRAAVESSRPPAPIPAGVAAAALG